MFAFAEEPYQEGSGSGSGGGSIEDNEEGSGFNPIEHYPEGKDIVHPTHTNSSIDSTHIGSSAPGKSDKDTKTHIDDSDSNNVNKVNSNINNNDSGSGAASTRTQQMSLRRALLTYFLPIYLAWFGGLFSELL